MARIVTPSWVGPGLLILFMVPLLVYGAYSIGDRWYQNYLLTRQEESIRADVLRLREENLRLQRELVEARSDAAVEKTAREQIGLIRPGDTAIQLVGPRGASPSARPAQPGPAPSAVPAVAERPSWLRVLDGLFGR